MSIRGAEEGRSGMSSWSKSQGHQKSSVRESCSDESQGSAAGGVAIGCKRRALP